jgi:outer membrane protein OmpA-like peptidoglycan-associated protein
MDVMSLERNLRIVNGKLERPAVFDLVYPRDRSVKEWTLEIFDAQQRRIRGFRGNSTRKNQITWDGKDAWGRLIQGGAIYQYQLTLEFTDGSLSKSPLRMFGVNRTNAISFELTGASFETNTAVLNTEAMRILPQVVETLKKYPDEKVVVRGHTDSTGSPDWNAKLSLLRAQAVQSYLVASGVATERLVVEGAGDTSPVAPNDSAAGRARNRRVEIKALLEDTERARDYATGVVTGDRQVVVNGRTLPVEEDGSFRTTVDPLKDRGRVYVGLKTEDGGVAAATVSLPTITILEPGVDQKIEIGKREDVIRLMQPVSTSAGPRYPAIQIPVRGRTERGNQVFIDGEETPVDAEGIFKTRLSLAIGENTFGIVAVAPSGQTTLINLAADLTGVDEKLDVITVRRPVPRFVIELPPSGAVLPNTSLFVHGQVPPAATVKVNGWSLPVQKDGSFGGSVRLPEGPSTVETVVTMGAGAEVRLGRAVTVNSNHLFMVALGDATVSKISTDGPVPEKFEDDLSVDGRVALYLKGRIQGKYLITAGLDTGDGDLSKIGSRLNDRDNQDFYRHLDPDAFYPVYGDSSRTSRDVNSQGRFYALFEAPAGTFQWGNYQSGITGNEFSSFNRTLYGAKGTWRSLSKKNTGEPLGEALVFAALPETRSAHDEFLGTGGSLFFLRNKNVVAGSEKVRVELRDKITGIPIANITRRQYNDYEIDYAEGRLLFRAPVSSVADSSTVISDALLNGHPVFVVVDYEHRDLTSSSLDDTTYGVRAKHAVGENVTVGATYVKEERTASTYTLTGGDITVRAPGNTQLTMEFSESENQALPQFVSDDGGLSFTAKPVPALAEPAQAYRFEFATGPGRARFTGYFRHIDAGFSSSFSAGENEVDQQGFTAALKLGQNATLNLLADNREVTGISTTRTGTVQYLHKLGRWGLSAETRYRDTDNDLSPDLAEGIGAVRIDFQANPRVGFFARYQTDFLQEVDGVDAGSGAKEQTTLGVNALLSDRLSARAEATTGEQGDSALLGLSSKIDERTILYGTYTMTPDHSGTRTGTTTLGVTSALTERTRLYTEEQFKRNDRESAATSVVGVSIRLSEALTTIVALERTSLEPAGGGPETKRQAVSASLTYAQPRLRLFSKLESRRDEAAALDRDQWLTTNAVELRLTQDVSLLGRFSYGVTADKLTDLDESIFREQGLGLAYRPVRHDWLNLLARYSEIRNLPPDSQTLVRDETTDQVFSLQTVVDLHRRLRLTEKYAVRDRKIDQDVLDDLESQMRLWINRFDYHLNDSWDAALEYRQLRMTEPGDNLRDGFLFEINRLFFKHMRLGIGYNFTDFTDNELSLNDYSAKGFFFRIQGKY